MLFKIQIYDKSDIFIIVQFGYSHNKCLQTFLLISLPWLLFTKHLSIPGTFETVWDRPRFLYFRGGFKHVLMYVAGTAGTVLISEVSLLQR